MAIKEEEDDRIYSKSSIERATSMRHDNTTVVGNRWIDDLEKVMRFKTSYTFKHLKEQEVIGDHNDSE